MSSKQRPGFSPKKADGAGHSYGLLPELMEENDGNASFFISCPQNAQFIMLCNVKFYDMQERPREGKWGELFQFNN